MSNLSDFVGGGKPSGAISKTVVKPEPVYFKGDNFFAFGNPNGSGEAMGPSGVSTGSWNYLDVSGAAIFSIAPADINASATNIIGFVWYTASTVLFAANDSTTSVTGANFYFQEFDTATGSPTSGGVSKTVAQANSTISNTSSENFCFCHRPAGGFYISLTKNSPTSDTNFIFDASLNYVSSYQLPLSGATSYQFADNCGLQFGDTTSQSFSVNFRARDDSGNAFREITGDLFLNADMDNAFLGVNGLIGVFAPDEVTTQFVTDYNGYTSIYRGGCRVLTADLNTALVEVVEQITGVTIT